MAASYGPRGWRAALAAEERLAAEGSSRIYVQPAAADASARIGGDSVTETSRGQLSEHTRPWNQPQPMPKHAVPGVTGDTSDAGQMPLELWLRLGYCLVAWACLAFAAGWKLGRWNMVARRRRRKAVAAHEQKSAVEAPVQIPVEPNTRVTAPEISSAADSAMSHPDGDPQPPVEACALSASGAQAHTDCLTEGAGRALDASASSAAATAEKNSAGSSRDQSPPPKRRAEGHALDAGSSLQSASDGSRISGGTPSAPQASHYQSLQSLLRSKSSGADSVQEAGAGPDLAALQDSASPTAGSHASNDDGSDSAGRQASFEAMSAAADARAAEAAPDVLARLSEAGGREVSLADQLAGLERHPPSRTPLPPLPPAQDQAHLQGGRALSAEGEAAWREAVQLVSTATGRLGISLADMAPGDRVQLIGVAVGAWQTIQQRDAHRTAAAQGDEANQLRSQHNRLVHSGLADKQARHAAAEAARGVAALSAALADCTLAGLALMSVSLLYCGLRYGLLHVRLAACPSPVVPASLSIFHPWAVLAPLQAFVCWVITVGDVLLGVIMHLLAAFLVLKTRLLAGGATSFPLNRLLLGLGVACGTAGFFAVGKIGGRRERWLLMWWAWIGVQCAVTMNLQAVYTLLRKPATSVSDAVMQIQRSSTATSNACAAGSIKCAAGSSGPDHEASSALLGVVRAAVKPSFVVAMALWWPLTMGCAPFGRSVGGELRALLPWHTGFAASVAHL